ncbi:MAG: HlyU family transcriptional regulator [Granulosicoccus sp.]
MGLGQVLGKFFGGSKDGGSAAPEAAEAVEYEGYTIVAAPLKEGSQFKTAGSISREVDGELKTAQFIRADNHADRQSAVTHSEGKARQIIDEQGNGMFERGHV